jgi:tetratricopeptide (TPR) repeat protein
MQEEYFDSIHRYIDGAMSPAEKTAFEAQIKQNMELRQAVKMERILIGGIESKAEDNMRKTIQSVHQQLKTEGFFQDSDQSPSLIIKRSNIMKKIMAIAAVLVAIAAVVWILKPNTATNPNELFAKYHQPQQELTRTKQIIAQLESQGFAGPGATDTLRQALVMYENGQYNEALKLLTAYQENHKDDLLVQYYIGMSHMNESRYAKAIECLLPVSRSEGSDLKNDALWNLALCYLMAENGLEDAKSLFTQIANDQNNPNQKGAISVRDQLLKQ